VRKLVSGVCCAERTRGVLLALLAVDPKSRPSARDAVAMVDDALRHASTLAPQWVEEDVAEG
jgi:hypothetical protein